MAVNPVEPEPAAKPIRHARRGGKGDRGAGDAGDHSLNTR